MSNQRVVGNVTFDFVEPDILRLATDGLFDEVGTRALMELLTEYKSRGSIVRYLLVDSRRASSVSPEARRAMIDISKHHPEFTTVLFGSSFALRVVSELIYNAIKILRRDPSPMHFADTESGAMEWIAQHRTSKAG